MTPRFAGNWLGSALAGLREARWLTRRMLMIGGVVLAALWIALVIRFDLYFTADGLAVPGGAPLAIDFLNYYAAVKAAIAGHAATLYDREWFRAFEQGIVGRDAAAWGIYSYPPFMLLLCLPLALLPYVPALTVWTLLGLAAAFALLRRLVGGSAAAVALTGAPVAFYNLLFGQNGYFTAALLAGGLMALERQPLLAGFCFGCLAYKPQLGVLLPVALLAGGHLRAFAAAAATVALLVTASIAAFGIAPWAGFLGNIGANRHIIESYDDVSRLMTVFAGAREIGAGLALAYAAQAISGLAALAAIVVVWRSRAPFACKAAALCIAPFLATPYALDYDAAILVFAAAWLGCEGLRTGFQPWERLAALALLLLPGLMFLSARLGSLPPMPVAPVVLWLGFVLVVRRARDPALAGDISADQPALAAAGARA